MILVCALGGAGVPARAQQADPAPVPATGPDAPDPQSLREIVVHGQIVDGSFAGIGARDEIDEADVAAYGLDKVGDLLDELSQNLTSAGRPPVVLINGEPANGLDDVSEMPTEAVRKVQVLPPDLAQRYGASRTTPVVNVVLKTRFRQLTGLGEAGAATAGGAARGAGELTWTRFDRRRRDTIALHAGGEAMLTEAARDIARGDDGVPPTRAGTVFSADGAGEEIDPALSAIAGYPVTVTGAPAGTASPTLGQFAQGAGAAGAGAGGDGAVAAARSLVPASRDLWVKSSFYRRVSPNSSVTLTARAGRTTTRSLSGLASASLFLPPGSPFSPFDRAVFVARAYGPPLAQDQTTTTLDVALLANTQVGAWRLTTQASVSHALSRTRSDRGINVAALGGAVASGLVSPFGPLAAGAWDPAMRYDRARTLRDRVLANLNASGPVFDLPAGAVEASVSLATTSERAHAFTSFLGAASDRDLSRDEALAQASLDVPLLATGAVPRLPGAVSLTLAGTLRRVAQSGTFTGYGWGLRWQPVPPLQIEGGISQEQVPPAIGFVGDARVVRDNVRVYDFLTGDTVEVRSITGGNPDLAPERRRSLDLRASLEVLPHRSLTLETGFSSVARSDVAATLPPASAEVQAAYPDRYVRDASGTLVLVDARPVSFAHVDRRQLDLGLRFRGHIGGGGGGGEVSDAPDEGAGAGATARAGLRRGIGGLRFYGSVTHGWVLRSRRQARTGLPYVDLLGGGALGYGGGEPRHSVRFTLGGAARGIGAEVKGSWTSPSRVEAGGDPQPGDLRFGSFARVDARLFADLFRLFPQAGIARGLRVEVAADNLFDGYQRVTDRSGATPEGYQRFLVDPRGRVIMVRLRKAV